MKLKRNYLLILLPLLSLPSSAYAYSQILDLNASPLCNFYLEIIGFSISIVAIGFMVSLMNKLSGLLRRACVFLLMAGVIFAMLQLWAIISIFYNIDANFVFCILEIAIPIFIILGVLTFKKLVMGIVADKSFSQNGKK